MSWWEAALLGVVQGLTEFLPVSSSAHLVLGQALLGIRVPGVLFEAAVHLATLCAVLWVYRRRVAFLVSGAVRGDGESWRYIGLLALASLPAGAVGLLGAKQLTAAFEEPLLAAALLLVTGFMVFTVRRTARTAADELPDVSQSLWVGAAQALAILPGISRSGATVATGSWRGVEVTRMAEFSFLLSVPTIAGATGLQVAEEGAAAVASLGPALGIGFAAATASGVLAIRLFVRMLKHRSFHWFAYYCWTVGSGFLLAAWLWPSLRG